MSLFGLDDMNYTVMTQIHKKMLILPNSIPLSESYCYTVRRTVEAIGRNMNMYYCRKAFATYSPNK